MSLKFHYNIIHLLILLNFQQHLSCQSSPFPVAEPGKMILTLKLHEESAGKIEVFLKITEDTSNRIFADTFHGKDITVHLQLEDSILMNDPVLEYVLNYSDGSLRSAVFPGENDAVTYDIENNKTIHRENNKFYRLTQLTNHYEGDSSQYYSIIKELANLYKKYPSSVFISYIIYNATVNKLIARKELNEYFNINNSSAYWIKKLKDYLPESDTAITNFLDTLHHYTARHENVLLKFWGSWCKPCLADNEKIEKIFNEGSFVPFIIGIQNDKKDSGKHLFYLNFLDKTRAITSHYDIGVFPTYILIKHGSQFFRSTSLDEIMDYWE